ncbi:MAG TPA: hypothetical protein VGK13_01385 [Methanocellaceae archaeon]
MSAAPAIAGSAAYINPNNVDGHDNPLAGGNPVVFAPGHVSIASPTMTDTSIVFANGKPSYMLTGTIDNPVKNDQVQQQLNFMYDINL